MQDRHGSRIDASKPKPPTRGEWLHFIGAQDGDRSHLPRRARSGARYRGKPALVPFCGSVGFLDDGREDAPPPAATHCGNCTRMQVAWREQGGAS